LSVEKFTILSQSDWGKTQSNLGNLNEISGFESKEILSNNFNFNFFI
jgi:hypothetical protein